MSATASSDNPDWLLALAARARTADGAPPFSDQSLVGLRTGARRLVSIDERAAALVSDDEAEIVVDPDARGRGLGTALLERVLADAHRPLSIWAHNVSPAARALAARHGLTPVRELLHLRRDLDERPGRTADQAPTTANAADGITTFRPGTDEAAWLDLNARAFSWHPEQGAVTRADLDELMAEDWFDAEDFLMLWDGDRLAGFCWLKIEGETGEFYVVAVDPDRQGTGLGRRMVDAGLARLRARGIRLAHLYVEGDNTAAVRLYRSLGFTDWSVDVQYRSR